MPKEDLSAEVEEISHEVAADAGTDKVDLMDCAAKEIEALPGVTILHFHLSVCCRYMMAIKDQYAFPLR